MIHKHVNVDGGNSVEVVLFGLTATEGDVQWGGGWRGTGLWK